MQRCSGNYHQILSDLIGFATVSNESNLAVIEYINSLLKGIANDSQYFYNADENKANLLVQIGPDGEEGILLAGHTDVVPVAGQNWSLDPFEAYLNDGKIFGRGSCDMKGFIALVIDVLLSIDINRLKYPVFLLFTYDEEVGCFGAKDIKQTLSELSSQIAFAIIGEPTNLELVTAHKGLQAHKTFFQGVPAHSSCPHLGKSAILSAASFIEQLNSVLPTAKDDKFNPPYSSYNPGMINGGNAMNIIPEHCEIFWECRLLPQFSNDSVIDNLERLLKQIENETGVRAKNETISFVPGLKDENTEEMINWLLPLLPDNTPVSTVSFVTEAGIFQQAGIPTVVYGPGHINQAHKPDEYVSVESMEQYRKVLQNIIEKLCAD